METKMEQIGWEGRGVRGKRRDMEKERNGRETGWMDRLKKR